MRISDWSSDGCSSDLLYDKLCLLASLVGLAAWVGAPDHALTGAALLAAGALQLARLARWQGQQTLSEPLVWSLHLGFLWLPLGLLLLGLGVLLPMLLTQTAGLRSEEHTSELQSLMRISYAVF